MAVRFVIGRAGTGKTHHCLASIQQELSRDPLDGPRLILLVPEQAALQMERAVIETADLGAAHRAEVLSFRRLAFRVLSSSAAPERPVLSEAARAMVLRHLLRRNAGKLGYYRRMERMGGFVERLGRTITELLQEQVGPEELEAWSGAGKDPVAAARRAKLADIAVVYRAYLDWLGDGRRDTSQYLADAIPRIRHCRWVTGCRIWVDGFASFSRQELLALVELARVSESAEICLLADPAVYDSKANEPSAEDELFARTLTTATELRKELRGAGLSVEEPVLLRPSPSPRFTAAPGLELLERQLFRPGRRAAQSGNSFSGIELAELPNRRLEVDFAVSRLLGWVREVPGIRFRDCALIVRDLEPYHDLLRDALSARGVPFFIDRRRPIAHHPLIELLRSGVVFACDGFPLDAARLLLKTGLLPLSARDSDLLENYLIAHGVASCRAWQMEWTQLERRPSKPAEPPVHEQHLLSRLNRARTAFLAAVDPLVCQPGLFSRGTGREWSGALRAWLDHLGIPLVIERWIIAAEKIGETGQAAEHDQVLRDVLEFINELGETFATERLDAAEFSDLLDHGLAALSLGLAPPMVDQVLVGSIERSRHPTIRNAVLLGFNDGIFPKPVVEDSILHDEERQALRDEGVLVGPPAGERAADEAMLAYIALTRASERLVVTWCAAGEDGKTLRPSPLVEDIRKALPGLGTRTFGDPGRERADWDVQTHRDLARRVATEFAERPALSADRPAVRAKWNSLYELCRERWQLDSSLGAALSGLARAAPARLSAESIARLYPQSLRTSASQLESYATCPFKHFAEYVLRLKEREQAALNPLDVGSLHHGALEGVARRLLARRQRLAAVSDAELGTLLDEAWTATREGLAASDHPLRPRDGYLVRHGREQLGRVLRAQRTLALGGNMQTTAAELPFGFEEPASLPPVEISTPGGRRVLLRGYIDRLDLAEVSGELLGMVIDYKLTRDKRLQLDTVFHGLSLQLPAYLLALEAVAGPTRGRPIRPVGAVYVSLAPRYELIDSAGGENEEAGGIDGTYPPRGLISGEAFDLLQRGFTSGQATGYSFFRTAGGAVGKRGDGVEADEFRAVLEHARRRIGELADAMLDGSVEVRPYRLGTRSPCTWCKMARICRFEVGLCDVNYLSRLSRGDALQRMVDAGGSGTASPG